MRQDPYKLRQLLMPVIEAMGYELVGVEFHPSGANALLRIYIDKAPGVDVADCQRVSVQVSALLDVEDPIPGRYTLEVSSPGFDRPLFDADHFDRFAGHRARIELVEPLGERRKLTGLLKGTVDDDVIVEIDGADLRVPLERIGKARLIPQL